jgi:two-component system chemotaxis response regulator CheY
MKILIADDDFVSRRLLQQFLRPYGECDFACSGSETLEAFQIAQNENSPYQLICLDINMPTHSGLAVLKQVRELEAAEGIGGLDGVKIVMTTGNGDAPSILKAFKEGCEAYIIKPLDREKLLSKIESLGLTRTQR